MDKARGPMRATLSLAAFVFVCFFLPWAQVSCVGGRGSVSGLDLARDSNGLLWLIPAFMLLIILLGLLPSLLERVPALFAMAGTVGGSLSAFLIYHERSRVSDAPKLAAVEWGPFFWLGLLASLGIAACALVFYARSSRSP
jgi:hypothetical protein